MLLNVEHSHNARNAVYESGVDFAIDTTLWSTIQLLFPNECYLRRKIGTEAFDCLSRNLNVQNLKPRKIHQKKFFCIEKSIDYTFVYICLI